MRKLSFKIKTSNHYGQSTVEYAAALVVAAILIAGIIPLSSQSFVTYYQNVFSTATNYIESVE